MTFENIHEPLRIDNIHIAPDHGTNHTYKLVIEAEMFMIFPWWIEQVFI